MNNGLIIDAVFALVLIAGAIFGAKRGLFRSMMGLVTVVLALLGAVLLSDLTAQPVTEALMPHVEESVGEWFLGEKAQESDVSGEEREDEGAPAEEDTDEASSATGLLKKLLRFDLDGAVRESLKKSAQDAALAAVRSLLGSVVRTVLFLVSFLLLTLLLKLFTRGLDRVFSLPVLHTLNSLGGGALGLVESALLLFLVCALAPKLGIAVFEEYEAGTCLLSFFMHQSPRSFAAALLSKS